MENNLKKNNPIGVFDSGIGGLTVAHAIQQKLPNEQLIYFGDTAHLPYGDKESYSIKHYATEISKFLVEKNCKAIIIACHTASAIAYKEIQKVVGNKAIVINVIEPVVKLFSKDNFPKQENVGIIGTKGTIRSNIYTKLIKAENDQLGVKSLETPLLAPMIEEGFINDKISQAIIDSYLSNKTLNEINHIVLACTHYPLIKKQIASFYNDKINVIDSSEVVAQYLYEVLRTNNLLNNNKTAQHTFYVSDFTESFEKSTRFFFEKEITLEKKNIWS